MPVLDKDLELLEHLLITKNKDNEAPFTPYYTKNHRKKLHQTTRIHSYNTRSKAELKGG